MWLRTTMNYQYRYGGSFQEALSKLYNEGGISRLYQGLPFALVQGPLTRFGDTAANVGMLALLSEYSSVPIIVKTVAGSIAAGMWRIVLMPIDTSKTAMQVEGAQGLQNLAALVVDKKSPSPLYQGAIAAAAATAVGHFPWFLTFNFLNNAIPSVDASEHLLQSLLRSAFLGVCSSCVSDTCSNSLRVIKTTKQTAALSSSSSNNNNNRVRDGIRRRLYEDVLPIPTAKRHLKQEQEQWPLHPKVDGHHSRKGKDKHWEVQPAVLLL
mmetsp:Transcript_8395/g.12256  ORF Transcript_8395/g.12256 Transcript_8395/m.12256 type:complete len:267 (-) Transcript_8395:245-1045(-)